MMDNLRFWVLFNSILVKPGRCLDDNEKPLFTYVEREESE